MDAGYIWVDSTTFKWTGAGVIGSVEGVDTAYGYPTADATGIIAALSLSDDWETEEVTGYENGTPPVAVDAIAIFSSSLDTTDWDFTQAGASGCYVVYVQASREDDTSGAETVISSNIYQVLRVTDQC